MLAKRLVFCFVLLLLRAPVIGHDMEKLLSRFESEHEIEAQTQALHDVVRSYGYAAGPELLKIGWRTTDRQTKSLAIWALGDLEFQEAAQLIVSSLRDDNLAVRRASAHALYRIKDDSSIPLQVDLLKNEQDDDTVRFTAEALASQRATVVLPALKLRANDGPTETRVAVIFAIGDLGSKNEVPYLITFLDDRGGFVALTAIKGIEHWSGENSDSCGKNLAPMKKKCI
jgi:HEAT repeat protein